MWIAAVVGGVVAGIVGLVIWRRHVRDARRMQLRCTPIDPAFKSILQRNVPLYARLPDALKTELEGLVNVFLDEKRFEGCGGQEITDEVRVTIAGQACILLLNRPTRYFPKLRTILVYPATYVAEIPDHGGQARQGESWKNGPVVLAWNCVTGGANNITDGKNVVLHEFSHRLDQEDGSADGAPILESRSCYATWAKVLSEEYDVLRGKSRKRRRSVLNKYGATAPAEFFAVATEAFLEKSRQMKRKHPELYDELSNYYKLDPAEWRD